MKNKQVKKKYVVLLSTASSQKEASRIAAHLVKSHLVACVNLVPAVQSIYWWDSQVNSEPEVLMIMKTEKTRMKSIERAIRSLHSYQTPELIAFDVVFGMPEYLAWISSCTSSRKRKK